MKICCALFIIINFQFVVIAIEPMRFVVVLFFFLFVSIHQNVNFGSFDLSDVEFVCRFSKIFMTELIIVYCHEMSEHKY